MNVRPFNRRLKTIASRSLDTMQGTDDAPVSDIALSRKCPSRTMKFPGLQPSGATINGSGEPPARIHAASFLYLRVLFSLTDNRRVGRIAAIGIVNRASSSPTLTLPRYGVLLTVKVIASQLLAHALGKGAEPLFDKEGDESAIRHQDTERPDALGQSFLRGLRLPQKGSETNGLTFRAATASFHGAFSTVDLAAML
jgi:hypothetical protein